MVLFPYSMILGFIDDDRNTYNSANENHLSAYFSHNVAVENVPRLIDRYINTKFLRQNIIEEGSTEDKLNPLLELVSNRFRLNFAVKSNSLMECVFMSIVSGLKEIKTKENDDIDRDIGNIIKWLKIAFELQHERSPYRPSLINNLMKDILPRIYNLAKILEINKNELVFSTENRIRWLLNFLNTISQMVSDRVWIASSGIVRYRWIYQDIEKIIEKECSKITISNLLRKYFSVKINSDKINNRIQKFIYDNEEKNVAKIKTMIENMIICLHMATCKIDTPEEEYSCFKAILRKIESIKQGREDTNN